MGVTNFRCFYHVLLLMKLQPDSTVLQNLAYSDKWSTVLLDFFALHNFRLPKYSTQNKSALGCVATENTGLWLPFCVFYSSLRCQKRSMFFLSLYLPSDRKPAQPPALPTSLSERIQVNGNAG